VIVIGTTSAHDDRMSEGETGVIETRTETETEIEATATVGAEVARHHDVQGGTKKILMTSDVVRLVSTHDDLKNLHDVLPLPLENVSTNSRVYLVIIV